MSKFKNRSRGIPSNVQKIITLIFQLPRESRTTDAVIEYAQEKDFMFKRMKRNVLEKLVEEALITVHDNVDDSSNEEEDLISHDSDAVIMDTQQGNSLNSMLAAKYSKNNASSSEIVSQIIGNNQPNPKKRKRFDGELIPTTKFSDLGGLSSCIEEVREFIQAPMLHPEIYKHLNVVPPRGVLLYGPSGCGKTKLAFAIAGELQVPFLNISAPSIVSGTSGDSEKRIRELFKRAKELSPCLVFVDEIDAITPKRESAGKEMERRIVAQLICCMDDLAVDDGSSDNKQVIIIGATNRPDSLDPALRRAGRFDKEICLGVPDELGRLEILKVLTRGMKLSSTLDLSLLAKLTPGYVGADLSALSAAAGVVAVKRAFGSLTKENQDNNVMYLEESSISKFLRTHKETLNEEELSGLSIEMVDFNEALKKTQPSSKREGFASVPDVSWDDIGALVKIREELRMSVVEPMRYPELFAKVGILKPFGVLLYGPPGCGKTLLAKAVANESHCNFISVKGPELLNKYVGESERGIRQVFARARASQPCVIFFDELDSLCPTRGVDSSNSSSDRVVNQLLTELDGMEGRQGVYVIAATNRPNLIDPAMLRPGRLDKLVYIGLPNEVEREEILRTLSRHVELDDSVDFKKIAEISNRFSGADLSALLREAGIISLKRAFASGAASLSSETCTSVLKITQQDFEDAAKVCGPSVSKNAEKNYQNVI